MSTMNGTDLLNALANGDLDLEEVLGIAQMACEVRADNTESAGAADAWGSLGHKLGELAKRALEIAREDV